MSAPSALTWRGWERKAARTGASSSGSADAFEWRRHGSTRFVTRSVVAIASVVPQQGNHVVPRELPSSTEEPELDDEGEPDDDASQALDEPHGGRGGAARRQHVVDDQRPLPRPHRVLVDLQEVRAVLELVLLA